MLQVKNLNIKNKNKTLVKNTSFEISPGEIVGLTGESGAGKTTILKSILGMIDGDCSLKGQVLIDEVDISKLTLKQHREICGTTLGFIPQIPMTAFDPRLTIGYQLKETFTYKLKLNDTQAKELAVECLKKAKLNDFKRILNSKPNELSGGMLQRVSIAFLIGLSPKYILADEPTSALDVKNRDYMLEILNKFKSNAGILFVSHDFEALNNLCDRVIVLSGGLCNCYENFNDIKKSCGDDWTTKFIEANKTLQKEKFTWTDLY